MALGLAKLNQIFDRWLMQLPRLTQGGLRAYLLAIILVMIAWQARLALAPADAGLQFLTFFPAVTLTILLGGLGPGLLASMLSILLANYAFVAPYNRLTLDFHVDVWISSVIFVAENLIVIVTVEVLQRIRAQQSRQAEEVGNIRFTKTLLKSNEKRLVDAQRIAHLGNWEWNLENGEIIWSDETFRIFGLQPQAVTPSFSLFIELVHADDRDRVNQEIKKALEQDQPYHTEFRIVRPDGSLRYVFSQGEVNRDGTGKVMRIFGTNLDITERKINENSLRLHGEILMHVQEGVQMTRISDERIVYATPVFERMFGYDSGELVGKHVSILNAPTVKSPQLVATEINATLEAEGRYAGEITNIAKDGSLFYSWVNITTYEHYEYGPVWVAVHENISARKIAEQALEKERGIAYRELLVREVHHRIKNNLQGIIGVLRQNVQQYPDTAGTIKNAISQVQSIAVIHGLQGRATLSEVRLCELTGAIAGGVGSLWEAVIMMDIPEGWTPYIIAETEAVPMALVINELISNAVKHNSGSHPVEVKIRHVPEQSIVRLTIRNIGILGDGPTDTPSRDKSIGLQLVESLLPSTGARVSWMQEDEAVITLLELGLPVIKQEMIH